MTHTHKKGIRLSIFLALGLFTFVLLSSAAHAGNIRSSDLKDGDLVSAAGSNDPDVYIVKKTHVGSFKRVFPNPQIFNFYSHLGGFSKVRHVSTDTREEFQTSALFRAEGDEKVYCLEMTGEDTAQLLHVTATGEQAVADDPHFFPKVFTINSLEFDWYKKGTPVALPSDCPVYSRNNLPKITPHPTNPPISTDNPSCPVSYNSIGKPVPSTSGTFTANSAVYLRKVPETYGKVLLTIPSGATVSVSETNSHGYYHITYNGTAGWQWHEPFECTY